MPVSQLPKSLDVDVKQQHINDGCREASEICPVALAVLEAIEKAVPEAMPVVPSVTRQWITIFNPLIGRGVIPERVWGPCPAHVHAAIARYDTMGEMSPFTFKLVFTGSNPVVWEFNPEYTESNQS